MDLDSLPFSEPVASTSRAVVTLSYKPAEEEEEEAEAFDELPGLELYERAWATCNAQVQSTLSSLHDASLDQIVAFVHAASEGANSLYSVLSARVPLRAGLVIGAAPGSSSLLYSSLIRLLAQPFPSKHTSKSSAPCIVSRISSRDCSNIKNALRSLIGGFVGSAANVELDEDDEDDELDFSGGRATLKSQLLVPEDMLNLVAWYEHRFAKKESGSVPTLAVLIEDLEAMDGKVLTQLIETLSNYTSTLPLVLLVGVATTVDALYSLVPRKVCNKLDAQSFFVDPGVGAFNALIRGVFIDSQPPLSLDPKAYSDLWRTFEDLHHSIDATISFIQYLYMSHFISQPSSVLTLPSPLDVPIDGSVELIRSLPSLVSSAASVPPSPIAQTLLDPTTSSADFTAAYNSCRMAVGEWHQSRSVAFEALLVSMEFWQKVKPVENCLQMLLGEGGGMGMTVDDVCGSVLQASSSKLPNFLRLLIARLIAFHDKHPLSSSTLLDFLTAQLATLQPILDAPRPAGRSNLVNSNLAGALALPAAFAAAAGGAAGLTQLDKEFSKVANEVAQGLKENLKNSLRPCTELLLHELWFSNDLSALKRFNPATLPSVFRTFAKADPYSDPNYVEPPQVPSLPAAETPLPLDLAVAYRTYAESHPSGRLANLGEWWASFELQAADEPEEGGGQGGRKNGSTKRKGQGKATGKVKKRARREEEEREMTEEEEEEEEEDDEEEEEDDNDEEPLRRKQARFLRAVGDLAHLGFLHPSTYKPEHVLKSVY